MSIARRGSIIDASNGISFSAALAQLLRAVADAQHAPTKLLPLAQRHFAATKKNPKRVEARGRRLVASA